MEKYTALYLRVSTDKQVEHGTSLQYQEESCKSKAFELGVPEHLIKVYREEGESGEDIDRTKMNKLREDVVKGLIKRIIIVHPDRLSRNMVDRLIVCAEFDKHEVELIFLDVEYKDSEEGRLFFNIQSSISQYELALIKKRTKRGSIKSSQNGEIMGMRIAPYGYDYFDKQLIINKTEAEFVKKIYQWYVFDKLTMRQIGEKLCSLGAIPKRKNIPEWSASSIQRILKNETYAGKFYYNRRETKKVKGEKTKSGKPKRTYEYRDKDEWIEIETPMIIDVATFMLAQEQREKNFSHSGNIKHEYLLRQKIRCGHCGNKYSSYSSSSNTKSKKTGEVTSSHSYRNYRCTNKNYRKFGEEVERCVSKAIRADYIEKYIWDELIIDIITNTDDLIERMESRQDNPNNEIVETYHLLKLKIDKLEEEKKRTIQLFKKGYIEEDEMETDLKKVENQLSSFKSEIAKYEKQINDVDKKKMDLEMLKLRIGQVKEKIQSEDVLSFKTKRQIVDYFIDEIIVKWEDDKVSVTTVGIIDDFINNKLCDSSPQHQGDIDTTNIVVNAVFKRKREGKMKKITAIKKKIEIR